MYEHQVFIFFLLYYRMWNRLSETDLALEILAKLGVRTLLTLVILETNLLQIQNPGYWATHFQVRIKFIFQVNLSCSCIFDRKDIFTVVTRGFFCAP